jgi:hypothetical protein
MTAPHSTGVSALDVAAADASKDHTVTMGQVEVGQIWAPGQLPALLHATAETLAQRGATE